MGTTYFARAKNNERKMFMKWTTGVQSNFYSKKSVLGPIGLSNIGRFVFYNHRTHKELNATSMDSYVWYISELSSYPEGT